MVIDAFLNGRCVVQNGLPSGGAELISLTAITMHTKTVRGRKFLRHVFFQNRFEKSKDVNCYRKVDEGKGQPWEKVLPILLDTGWTAVVKMIKKEIIGGSKNAKA